MDLEPIVILSAKAVILLVKSVINQIVQLNVQSAFKAAKHKEFIYNPLKILILLERAKQNATLPINLKF